MIRAGMIRADMIRARLSGAVFISALFVSGATTLVGQGLRADSTSAMPTAAAADSAQSDRGASQPQLEQRNVIQRQDELLLTFPLSPELNQTVTVQPDGYINLQNGRSVHAQGLSVPELVEVIKTAYVGTLHNPIVNVDLKDFQKPFFTVSGQVGKPGQYELRADITIAEAIAVAGGLAPTAKTQIFLFHRTSDQWFEVKKVNLKDVMHGKNVNEDAILKPGDMIFVPETFITSFRKYVPYSINAGTYLTNGPL
jgi:polysaccharide export outer membrane protein